MVLVRSRKSEEGDRPNIRFRRSVHVGVLLPRVFCTTVMSELLPTSFWRRLDGTRWDSMGPPRRRSRPVDSASRFAQCLPASGLGVALCGLRPRARRPGTFLTRGALARWCGHPAMPPSAGCAPLPRSHNAPRGPSAFFAERRRTLSRRRTARTAEPLPLVVVDPFPDRENFLTV